MTVLRYILKMQASLRILADILRSTICEEGMVFSLQISVSTVKSAPAAAPAACFPKGQKTESKFANFLINSREDWAFPRPRPTGVAPPERGTCSWSRSFDWRRRSGWAAGEWTAALLFSAGSRTSLLASREQEAISVTTSSVPPSSGTVSSCKPFSFSYPSVFYRIQGL